MGQLRDFFAAIGFCESTSDLARRPQLIERLIDYSIKKTPAANHDPLYRSKLTAILESTGTSSLDLLLKERIILSLDRRLPDIESGFFDGSIYAIFYNSAAYKILSLYDNDKLPEDNGFFETGILDWSPNAIEDLAESIADGEDLSRLLIGTTHSRYNVATKTTQTYFAWNEESDFENELNKNPALRTPPVKFSVLNLEVAPGVK